MDHLRQLLLSLDVEIGHKIDVGSSSSFFCRFVGPSSSSRCQDNPPTGFDLQQGQQGGRLLPKKPQQSHKRSEGSRRPSLGLQSGKNYDFLSQLSISKMQKMALRPLVSIYDWGSCAIDSESWASILITLRTCLSTMSQNACIHDTVSGMGTSLGK
eukprot:Gb_25740 [translate_table: standard]